MAETVDTRVVEARFDSKQFEQGVDRTVKKLDELKKSLNLKNTEKSVAEIGNKISETSEKASNSLEKLEERFTSFFGMLKNKMISGIADDIVGGIMKIKHGIEGLITSLSSAQVSYGMQRYTDILTSVRTMTGAGVEQNRAYELIERLGIYADQTSYSLENLVDLMSKLMVGGAGESQAEKMVEGLSNAAASVGVNAQKATTAYYNFAQAYQKGAMLQQDWMSFQNIGMSGEKMNEMILKAAEEVGTLVKQTEKNGQIVYKTANKVDKMVKTSGGDSKGITAQNLGSKLSSRWFNKAVMEKWTAEMYYFSDITRAELGKIEDAIEGLDKDARSSWFLEHGLSEFAYDAFKAGQEARSFTDVLNTLKDSISRGWATSFELIFGKLDEATKFFTALTESNFADAIYNIAEFRNEVLESWSDTGGRNSMLRTLQTIDDTLADILVKFGWLKDAGWDDRYFEENFSQEEYNKYLNGGKYATTDKEGKEIELEGKEAAEKYKEDIKNAALEANPFDDFARELGQRLTQISIDIQDFFQRVRDWFNKTDKDGVSRLQRIQNILESFGTVFTGTMNAVGLGLKFVGDIYHSFQKTFDSLWAVFDKLAKTFAKNFDEKQLDGGINAFQILKDVFNNIITVAEKLDPILSVIVDALGEVASFFIDMGVSSVLMNLQFFTDAFALLLEVLGIGSAQQKRGEGVLKGIGDGITQLADSCKSAFQAVTDFFSSLFDDLRKLLGLGDDIGTEDGGLFKSIENWFNTNEFVQKVKAWIDKAIVDIGDFVKDMPNRLSQFGIKIGDILKSIFYEKRESSVANTGLTTTEWIAKPLTKWLEQAGKDVWSFITVEIPKFIQSIPSIVTEFINGLLYEKKTVAPTKGSTREREYLVSTPLKQWLDQAVLDVQNFVTVKIPKFVRSIPSMIGKFFDYLFGQEKVVHEYKDGKLQSKKTKGILRGWLDNAIVTVKGFIKELPSKIAKIPSIIGEFLKSLFYDKKIVSDYGVAGLNSREEWVKKPFTEWIDKNIIAPLREFVSNLPDYIGQGIGTVANFAGKVVSAIFGKEDGSEVVADDVTEGIRKPFLGMNVTGVINSIKGVAKRILNGVISAFTGETDWDSNKNMLAEGVAGLIGKIETFGSDAWDGVKAWIESLPTKIKTLFEGGAKDAEGKESPIGSAILSFGEKIGEWISQIPGMLLSAWDSAVELASGLWKKINEWITGSSKSGANELDNANQKIYDSMMRAGNLDTAKMFKQSALNQQWREKNPIAANLTDFFVTLGDRLKEMAINFPETISTAWETFKNWITGIPDTVTEWLKGNADDAANKTGGISTEINNFIKNVGEWISKIPGDLLEIYKGAEKVAGSLWSSVLNWITGSSSDVQKLNNQNQSIYDTMIKNNQFDTAEMFKNSALNQQWREDNPIAANISDFFTHLVDYFKEKIEKLPENISNAWDTVKDVGSKIGPKILGFLQKALDWVNEKMTSLTTDLNNAHESGQSFGEILASKFNVTNEEGEKIENPLWTIVKNIGKSLKTFITETLPNFIGAAFEEVKTGIPKLIEKVFGGGNEDPVSEEVQKELDDYIKIDPSGYAAKKYEESIKQNAKKNKSVWDTIMDLLIPSAGAEEYLDDAKNQKDRQDKEDAKTITDKIRDKLGNFGGIMDLVKGIGDVAGSFLKSDFGKYLLLGVVISSILSSITEILSMTDEMEAAKDLAKWEAIKFAVLGIIAMLGYISYLAAQSDQTQLNKTMTALNNLADTFQKLMLPLEIIMGLGMAKSFFDWRTAKSEGDEITGIGETLVSKISDVFLGPLQGLTTTVGAGLSAGFLGQIGELLSGNLNTIFQEIGSGIESLSGYLGDTIDNLEKITGRVQSAITTVGEVKDLIKAFIDLLWFEPEVGQDVEYSDTVESFLDPSNYGWGTGITAEEANTLATSEEKHSVEITTALGKVTKAFSKMSGALSLFKESVSGYGEDASEVTKAIGDLTSMTGDMKSFGDFSETDDFIKFKNALTSLGAISRLFSDSIINDINDTPKKLDISGVVDLLKQLFGNEEFKSLITEFSKDKNLSDLDDKSLEKAERIIIFAGALSSIAKACSELSGDESKGINNLIKTINGIDLTGNTGKNIDDVAIQFGTLGNALGSFAESTSDINETNIKTAGEAINMLLTLAVGLKDIPNDTFLANLFTGDKSLGKFGLEIESLGTHLQAFFRSLDNVNSVGQSKDFNRKNLSMALLAVQGISEGVKIIANASHIATFKQNLEGSLTTYMGNLETLATNIMSFITTVNSYTDAETYGNIDYDFVFKAIDAVQRICEAVVTIPNVYQGTSIKVGERMDVLNKILFGTDGGNGDGIHKGILESLSDFLQKTVLITKNGEYTMPLSEAASMVSSYADVVEQIVLLVTRLGKINYEDLSADNINTSGIAGSYTNSKLTDIIIPSLRSINDDYDVIKEFLDNAETFNQIGLSNAVEFFNGLNSLADALYIFSQKDKSSEQYNVTQGLTKLLEFNWESLRSVIDDMKESLGEDEDFFNPKITPVLEITDDFRTKTEELRNLLGLESINDRISPSITINTDGITFPEPKDYSKELSSIDEKITQLNVAADAFNNSLSKMVFRIDGKYFSATIGPDIDEYLGSESTYLVRSNINNGGGDYAIS